MRKSESRKFRNRNSNRNQKGEQQKGVAVRRRTTAWAQWKVKGGKLGKSFANI